MIDDRDLDGIEDKFDSTFNTPEEVLEKKGIKRIVTIEADEDMCLRKRGSSELLLLKLMRICSKGLHRPIFRSLHRKMLTDIKLCMTKEMKKGLEVL